MLDLKPKDFEALWNDSELTRKSQARRQDYYDGNHDIIGRGAEYVDGSPKSERVANWIKYGVKMYVGSITAQEYAITNRQEDETNDGIDAYEQISDENNLNAVDVVNLTNGLVKDYGLECYHVTDGKISISACDPLNWELVYDSDGIMLGAIYRSTVNAGQFHRGERLAKDAELMVVYDDTRILSYERKSGENVTGDDNGWTLVEETPHPFGVVPLNVIQLSDNGESYLTDDILGQVDEYNDIDSMSGDDIRYDADGVLKISGYSPEHVKENAATIREYKILPIPVDGDASFIQKHSDTQRVESRLKRTREHIFTGLTVPDVESILGATGTTSGIALRLKFKPMIENANVMITHIKAGIRRRIDMINRIRTILNVPLIEDYNVIINFALPVNRVEEWQNIGNLTGIVSHRTQLEILSDVKNPEVELDRLRKEAEDGAIVAENSGTPEAVAARVEQQIQQQVPDMQAIVSGLVDALSDAALTVAAQRNNIKATTEPVA